jgi:hypothetical protein
MTMASEKGPRPPGTGGRVATYREDKRRAWNRINSFPMQRLDMRSGAIEYADQGEGLPLRVSH